MAAVGPGAAFLPADVPEGSPARLPTSRRSQRLRATRDRRRPDARLLPAADGLVDHLRRERPEPHSADRVGAQVLDRVAIADARRRLPGMPARTQRVRSSRTVRPEAWSNAGSIPKSATSSRRRCSACSPSPRIVKDRCTLPPDAGSRPIITRTSNTPGERSRIEPDPRAARRATGRRAEGVIPIGQPASLLL